MKIIEAITLAACCVSMVVFSLVAAAWLREEIIDRRIEREARKMREGRR